MTPKHTLAFVIMTVLMCAAGCKNPIQPSYDNRFDPNSPNRTPQEPTDLTVDSTSGKRLLLRWIDRSGFEDGYRIERGEPGGSLTELASVPANTVSYTDSTADPSKMYLYRIRGFSGARNGDYSQTIQAKYVPVEVASTVTVVPLSSTAPGGPVAYSPDGTLLAARVGSNITFWNTATGTVVRTIAASTAVNSLDFSPDGMLLAATADNSIFVYRAADGTSLFRWDNGTDAYDVRFSPDGTRLLFVSHYFSIRILSLTPVAIVADWQAHDDFIREPIFSPDGSLIASADRRGYVKLWNAADHTLLRTIFGGEYTRCAFDPEGTTIATSGRAYTGTDYGGLRTYRVADGTLKSSFGGISGNNCNPLCYTRDGATLVYRDIDKMTFADTRDNTVIFQVPLSETVYLTSMAVSPKDNSVTMTLDYSRTPTIVTWRLRYGWIKK